MIGFGANIANGKPVTAMPRLDAFTWSADWNHNLRAELIDSHSHSNLDSKRKLEVYGDLGFLNDLPDDLQLPLTSSTTDSTQHPKRHTKHQLRHGCLPGRSQHV